MIDYDRSHDDIDPLTGALTSEAVAKRQGIMERLGVNTWFEAVNHALFRETVGDNPDAPPVAEGHEGASEEQAADDGASEMASVQVAEKPADGDAEPGAVQEASEAGFEAEVDAEAKADVPPADDMPQAVPG